MIDVDATIRALLPRVRKAVEHELARRGRGTVEVDDVVAVVIEAVWRIDLPRFDPTKATLWTFVAHRVSWVVGDVVRKARRRGQEPIEERDFVDDEAAMERRAPLLTAEAACAFAERVTQARRVYAALSPEERRAIDILVDGEPKAPEVFEGQMLLFGAPVVEERAETSAA